MSAHTPGPWVPYREKFYNDAGMTQWKSTVIRPVVNGRIMSISIAKCDNEGNARLIAAAPDLLEACRASEQCIADVIELYKRGCSNLVMDEAIKSLQSDALKLNRAAIEKATGEPA